MESDPWKFLITWVPPLCEEGVTTKISMVAAAAVLDIEGLARVWNCLAMPLDGLDRNEPLLNRGLG